MKLLVALAALEAAVRAVKQPNIVVVLTDDQDVHMNSLDYMPILKDKIIDKGTLYENHYCTVAICCPSRVSLWTGKAAHNTNVTDVFPPHGGYPKFVKVGLNDHWLPVWLQELGYNTYYTGKLFNAHTVQNWNKPLVKGFNDSNFLLDPYTYAYYDGMMTRDGAKPVSYRGQYSPDVVAENAYEFLEKASSHDKPFFIGVAPIAPHSNLEASGANDMPRYAPRHKDLFKDYKIPRTPDFNPDVPSGVSWIKHMPQLPERTIEYYDEFQRARLRALQAVDEMVGNIVDILEEKNLLDDTYIFYTTDNGYHIGHHRMHPGKECPYQTDVHIPLAVRGPGVPAGFVTQDVTAHTDLSPTFLKLAGSKREDLDGTPLPLSKDELEASDLGEHVNVEFWGRAIGEGIGGNLPNEALNNTYKALRVIGKDYNLLYTVWCTGEREFYDLTKDPHQMKNYLDKSFEVLGADFTMADRSLEDVLLRLDSLLMVLKSCKAKTCRQPWSVLHPDGSIATISDALDAKFDSFYDDQPKVGFSSCELGYFIDAEGPQDVNPWKDEQYVRDDLFGSQQETLLYKGDYSLWT